MNSLKSDETNKKPTENNEKKSGLRKNFPGFAQLLKWEAESKGLTLEELDENMQRQCAITLRPHDQVMKEILGEVEWVEEEEISKESQDKDFDK